MIPTGDKIEKTYRYNDSASAVAVSTLASDYEKFDLKHYAIIGSVYTENFGVQLALTNILKNPNIRYLILCGQESAHLAGDAFKALHENGISAFGPYRKIIGCKSPLPFIDDIPEEAIDLYQERITVVDMIGTENVEAIQAKIDECIAEAKVRLATACVFDTKMPEVDELSWKKYSAIQDSNMKKKLGIK